MKKKELIGETLFFLWVIILISTAVFAVVYDWIVSHVRHRLKNIYDAGNRNKRGRQPCSA